MDRIDRRINAVQQRILDIKEVSRPTIVDEYRDRIVDIKNCIQEVVRCTEEMEQCVEEWSRDSHEYAKYCRDFIQRQNQKEQRMAAAAERASLEAARKQFWTLPDFLEAHHHLVYSRLPDEEMMLMEISLPPGYHVGPRSTLCPRKLKPWPDFLQQQRQLLGSVLSASSAGQLCLDDNALLNKQGDLMSIYPYTHDAGNKDVIEQLFIPVRSILNRLGYDDALGSKLNLGCEIIFPSAHMLDIKRDKDCIAVAMEHQRRGWPDSDQDSAQENRGQIYLYCFRGEMDEVSDEEITNAIVVAGVCDIQLPHKLSAPMLRAGLRRPLEMRQDVHGEIVIEQDQSPAPGATEAEAQFRQRAERLTLAALAPSYQFMLANGLAYGMVTTVDHFCFLFVDWKEPGTLYYHLAEPRTEAMMHGAHCSAVAQLLSFCLQVYRGSEQTHDREERIEAVGGALKWDVDFETELNALPMILRWPPLGAPDWNSSDGYADVDRTPVIPDGEGEEEEEES
ncbi:hypothetical protein XA68_17506 [Ophiocordyceps unilateralis]|uniref:Uncharacterized protein n=1 Tax=Ophiocordyceps unilateralis TaxID=268505 RepID=A0A2A9PJJ6_OPHUN|nr:hypothetical protein XA68_17506 [Ophiocordyceps unilateralis]